MQENVSRLSNKVLLLPSPPSQHSQENFSSSQLSGLSPVARAAYEGNLSLLKKYLKKSTANVSGIQFIFCYNFLYQNSDAEGRTPLYFAAIKGHTEIAALLLQKGAKVDLGKDGEGLFFYYLDMDFILTCCVCGN